MAANPFYVEPGANYGAALTGLGNTLTDYRQQRDEKAKQEQMVKRFAEVKQAMTDAYASGDPDRIAQVAIDYPEAQKTVEVLYGFKNNQTKQNALDTYRSVLANKDNPQEALNAINSRIAFVEEQGGDPSSVTLRARDQLQNMIESGQDTTPFFRSAELDYASLASPQEWKSYAGSAEGLTPYQQERLNLERQRLAQGGAGTANQKDWETYQRLKKENPAAAEEFGRAAGFTTKEGVVLSPYAEKQLDLASNESAQAASDSSRYETLANNIEKTDMSSGLKSTWQEYIKEQTGNQDEVTALRKEVMQIANSEAIKNLPPGPATDRDIELVRAPFPTDKASPEYVAKWLRAVSRLNKKRAEFADFKADFIARNGSLRTKGGESLVSAWKESQKTDDTNTVNWSDL